MIDEIQVVPPCRVLMRNGISVDELITERPRHVEPIVVISPRDPSTRRTAYAPADRSIKGRVSQPKRNRSNGKPHGGNNRRMDITNEMIVELQSKGVTCRAISERFGLGKQSVYKRLREFREENPEAYAQQRKCECGNPKRAYKPRCQSCPEGY